MDTLYRKECVCGAEFRLSSSFEKHRTEDCPALNGNRVFICGNCGIKFSKHRNLIRHLKCTCSKTSLNYKPKGNTIPCTFDRCDATFTKLTCLADHVEYIHNVKIEQHNLLFNDMKQFESWKLMEEKKTFSYYPRRHSSIHTMSHGSRKMSAYMIYACQFHGSERPHHKMSNTGRTRSKGRAKTGLTCYSHIIAKQHADLSVSVKYISSHNHPTTFENVKFQPLPASLRRDIVRLHSIGFTSKEIQRRVALNVSRSQRDQPTPGREQFVTLHNINYLVKQGGEEEDEMTAVAGLVEEWSAEDPSPVVVFQGLRDGLLVGLQSREQLAAMRGKAEDTFFMDVVYDSSGCGLQMLSVVACDAAGEELPVAHFLMSTADEDSLTLALTALRDTPGAGCGPRAVLSTDISLLEVAAAVYGQEVKCFLCHSFVISQWKKKLCASVVDDELINEILVCLVAILEEDTWENFEMLCKDLMATYEHELRLFLPWFQSYYLEPECVKLWSAVFRGQGQRNTALPATTFHDLWREKYLKRIPCKRADRLLLMLSEVEKDYYVKWSCREGRETPEAAKCPKIEDLFAMDGTKWKLRCPESTPRVCVVERVHDECIRDGCGDFAKGNTCVHLYTCNCQEMTLVCGHIKRVHEVTSLGARGPSQREDAAVLVEPPDLPLSLPPWDSCLGDHLYCASPPLHALHLDVAAEVVIDQDSNLSC